MRVPHKKNHESSDSVLNSLSLRHEADGRFYREGAGAVQDEGLREFLKSFAHYRHSLLQEVQRLLEDMPGIPFTPSRSSRSYFEEHQQEFEQALRSGNVSQLSDMIRQCEQDTSDYYRVALNTDGLHENIRTLLEKQHDKVLEFLRKADRMESVPQQRNNNFDGFSKSS